MFDFDKQGLIAGKSLDALDEVVRSAVSQQIAIILALSLDENRFSNKLKNDPEFPKELEVFWQALAAHYATSQYSPNLVLFEVLNEPGLDEPALTFEDWSRIQPGLVRAIRNGASQNTILAAGAEKSDINGLLALQTLKNVDNVIYVLRYYEPFSFTHQGEDWDKDHYAYHLAGVRYPYSSEPAEKAAKDVPGLANKLNAWHDMETATKDRIKIDFEIVDEWAQNEKVTVICDEFGVLKRGSDPKHPMGADPGDSAEWVRDVRGLLEQHKIRWAFWDYSSESFGLLDKTGQFDKGVITALGLKVPTTSTQVAPK
jgi:endoglucanase